MAKGQSRCTSYRQSQMGIGPLYVCVIPLIIIYVRLDFYRNRMHLQIFVRDYEMFGHSVLPLQLSYLKQSFLCFGQ